MNDALRLEGFGIAFHDRVVLASIDLLVAELGPTLIMGPGGSGKSTLLRTLAGHNEAQPALRKWGTAFYRGFELGDYERPRLVSQNAKLVMASVRENLLLDLPGRGNLDLAGRNEALEGILERYHLADLVPVLDESVLTLTSGQQRRIGLVRTAASGARLVMADEPCAGLEGQDLEDILDLIREVATSQAILVATHNLEAAGQLGGSCALLAGGVIQEQLATSEFLSSPHTEAGRAFVKDGYCSVPMAGTPAEYLSEDAPRPAALPDAARPSLEPRAIGPKGFHWVRKGMLGGTPRPGLLTDQDRDLDALQDIGIEVLVCLEEEVTIPVDLLLARSIRPIHFPIVDMEAPDAQRCADLCKQIESEIRAGHPVAYHCRAGLGRTGTMLAAHQIAFGASALEALEALRRIQPLWVQSQVQVDFLSSFEEFVRDRKLTTHWFESPLTG